MQKIVVKNGRVFASDRWWDAEWFDNASNAVEFARDAYAEDYLDLPPMRRAKVPSRRSKRTLRQACLGDFWPVGGQEEVAD